MRRVIIESPYAGATAAELEMNLRYLRACMADCIRRGEAPFASHALYTQPGVLRDDVPEEREAGIQAGFAWRELADATVVYTDRGMSRGMKAGLVHASNMVKHRAQAHSSANHRIEYRMLGADWDSAYPHAECATEHWSPVVGEYVKRCRDRDAEEQKASERQLEFLW